MPDIPISLDSTLPSKVFKLPINLPLPTYFQLCPTARDLPPMLTTPMGERSELWIHFRNCDECTCPEDINNPPAASRGPVSGLLENL